MNIDSIIGFLIVPIIFFWLGFKIYSHEKETIDKMINKIKGAFTKDEIEYDDDVNPDEYQINYRY